MSEKKAIKVSVAGRIQGVGYRAFVQQKATKLGLKGYIRNSDGSEVEVIAEGAEDSLEELLELLESGPNRAEIEDVNWEWIEHTGDFIRFSINY
ncbi:acylphosphatase [Fuchsiella alkaliacetigena]|uniref:acylphosphatase n=1 Tax=Fuchsiella alkaliacetigena TaxID=957042 RepID=UPI00200A870F|nr:acylphosphatase [Fuchsiella alkaliacetigena]MCK8823855.1 acylphosphatase [Fuchsiella alkaliacetigena]